MLGIAGVAYAYYTWSGDMIGGYLYPMFTWPIVVQAYLMYTDYERYVREIDGWNWIMFVYLSIYLPWYPVSVILYYYYSSYCNILDDINRVLGWIALDWAEVTCASVPTGIFQILPGMTIAILVGCAEWWYLF